MARIQAVCTRITLSPSWDVSFVYFKPTEKFVFLEGQFVVIETQLHGKPYKKPYSIATTYKEFLATGEIGIITKRTSETWMSAYLTKWITIWAQVTLIWPAGRYIDQKSSKNYFFISVWSGLGPNYSLLQAAHQNTLTTNESSWRIVNLFGERHYAHILPDVEQLFVTTQSDTTKHLLYLSQETQLPPMYHQGRIQLGIDEALEFLWEDFAAYICGTPAMVNDIKQELLQRNVSPSRIIVEKY